MTELFLRIKALPENGCLCASCPSVDRVEPAHDPAFAVHSASMSYVGPTQLDEWAISTKTVFDVALATMAGRVHERDVEVFDAAAPYSAFQVNSGDSYESSRLVLPGFLKSFCGMVNGAPIAIAPERDTLIVAGLADEDAVARLARNAEREFRASPRAISPAVYTTDAEGSVCPFRLPANHPHHHLVERGHKLLAAQIYADQEAELNEKFKVEGTDIFVATFGLIRSSETEETSSYAVMVKGVDTLLPEVDFIVVCDESQESADGWSAMVPWEAVFKLAGKCLELDEEVTPRRWRTASWPSESSIQLLRAAAVG